MNYPQIKPTLNLDFSNTKTLDPRINFRRGTPGAYYDGKTHAKAEENLLSYSEDFSNAYWQKLNVGAAANSILSPNGVDNSYTLTASANAGQHAMYIRYASPFFNKEITLSVFVKSGTSSKVMLSSVFSGENLSVDLSSQEIRVVGDILSYDITDVGNDWFRLSFTYLNDDSTWYDDNGLGVYILNDNWEYNFTTDGTETIYIWGAQLEQRDSVTAYTPTNGNPITKYQPKLMFASPDQPRFDHDVLTGESKGLLIEESRTNLTRDSQYFTSTNWSRFNTNIFSNYVVAPDGTLTGSVLSAALTEDGYVGIETIPGYITYTQGKSYTSSYYLKKGSHNYCQLYAQGLISTDFANFNLDTGEVSGGSNASIEHVGNGWYRCSLTVVANTSTVTAASFLVIVDSMSSTRAANKTYTNTDDNIYIWGAQLEEGSFPTSYIKTSGASATRSADNASITGENFSSWYRQDEGSIYSEASTSDFRSSYPRIMINDGNASNRIVMSFFGEQGLRVESNGVRYVDISNPSSSDDGNYHKRAIGLKEDSFSFYINGENVVSDFAGYMPMNVDRFAFYNNLSSNPADHLNGHIKKISYYPQRLTNEQLQQLTK
ncbi:MAG: hypothetical protein EBR72_08860 [Bacteroidetes bacterium]|nr:hypothetical protein [Bacteroidota bacterium]